MSIKQPGEIFLFWPNITGYIRVILSLWSFAVYENPSLFFTLYVTSFLLDAADGHLARTLNQCSRFGAVLDMITDRFSTAALTVILSHLYPSRWTVFAFICLLVLDICSHWLRMYSGVLNGKSHKDMDNDAPFFLRLYYGNRYFLGFSCLGNELFYVFLYANAFTSGHEFLAPLSSFLPLSNTTTPLTALIYLCAPVFAFKQFINVIQLVRSSQEICQWEFENEHSRK